DSSVNKFIDTTVKEAFTELKKEFLEKGIGAQVKTFENPKRMQIEIKHDTVNNFIYGVKKRKYTVSEFLLDEENLPDLEGDKKIYPESYFGITQKDNIVKSFKKTELF